MKKTSEEWSKNCNVEVLDPDGWDRKNFEYSWYEEKITRKEFTERLMFSTCLFPWPFPANEEEFFEVKNDI